MKTLLIVFALVGVLPFGLFAQTDEPEVRNTIYQVFIGEFDKAEGLQALDPLRELGFIRHFSLTNESDYALKGEDPNKQRIYVGPYLGKVTAEAVMARAWTLGFRDARIEANETYLNSNKYADLEYTVQLGAFEDPDMRNFEEIANLPAHGVFLMYEEGFFKILCGMYRTEETGYVRNEVIPYLRDMGYYGFIRTFRAVTEFAEAD